MGRAKGVKTTILMLIMVVLVIGYYSYLSSRNSNANSAQSMEDSVNQEMTVVQELIAKSAFKEYPTTPVQVLKYYNEITACYYNESYSDEELETLAKMAQDLCDVELNANQTWDSYMKNLKDDIQTFHTGNITIYKSDVTPATDVEYFEFNGYECARLFCVYTLKSGTEYQSSKEVYIMRKDVSGHWKIYGFDLVKPEQTLTGN